MAYMFWPNDVNLGVGENAVEGRSSTKEKGSRRTRKGRINQINVWT